MKNAVKQNIFYEKCGKAKNKIKYVFFYLPEGKENKFNI